MFEHEFDSVRFWHGIAEIACSYDEIIRGMAEAGVSRAYPGCADNPGGLRLRIELEDGRVGLAAQRGSRYWEDLTDRYAAVAFTGTTSLAPRPQAVGGSSPLAPGFGGPGG